MGRPPAGGFPGCIALLLIPIPDLNRVKPYALPKPDMRYQAPLNPGINSTRGDLHAPRQFIGSDKITGIK